MQPTFFRSSLQVLVALLATLLAAAVARAQAPDALVVTLRDERGAGLAGVTVIVLDRSGANQLSRGVTDSQGVVTFARLPLEAVRVTVAGTLTGGERLFLLGEDVQGIAVDLVLAPTRLELRVEPDGQVRPDPATMILPEAGALLEADGPVLPTAVRAETPAPASATPTISSQPTAPVAPVEAPGGGLWLGFTLLTVLITAIGAVVWTRAVRGRA